MDLSEIPERALIAILEKLPLRDIYNFINCGMCVYEAYHKINFHHIYEQIKHWPRKRQILAWFNYYYFLPPQGSRQWLAGRGCGIGGSELSTVEGNGYNKNKNEAMRELLARKLNLPEGKFDGSIATRWGHIFEPMLQIYVELMLDSRVYETGNIPGVIRNSHGRRVQNYSPDGVILAKKKDFKFLIDKTSQKYFQQNASNSKEFHDLSEELILLLEFKNPYMRIPKGEISNYYISQPKAGMCTIPITEAAMFVEGVFRKCSVDEFDLGPFYDTAFHCRRARRLHYQSAMACGFIGIYDVTKGFEQTENVDDHNSSDEWALTDTEAESESDESSEEAVKEHDPDDDMPRLNSKQIENIGKMISKYAILEIKHSKSDYYKTRFELSSLISMVKMLQGIYQNIIATKTYVSYNIPMDTASLVMRMAVHRLFKFQIMRDVGKNKFGKIQQKKLKQDDEIAQKIMPDLLKHLITDDTDNEYDIHDLNFGIDYGCTSTVDGCTAIEFEKLAEKIVNDRHDNGEYKMYHPDKFFFDVDSTDASKLHKPNNYIDYTLDPEKSAQKWLYQNTSEFIEWCKKKDVCPIGIIPWKLFEVATMEMYKDPKYLEKTKDKIICAMDIVDEINKKCDPKDIVGKAAMLDKYYPPPRKRKARIVPTKEQIRRREQIDAATEKWLDNIEDSSESSD